VGRTIYFEGHEGLSTLTLHITCNRPEILKTAPMSPLLFSDTVNV
jgi:hypothetical protein